MWADTFLKMVLEWEAYCREIGFQQMDHITKFQEFNVTCRRERKLALGAGHLLCPRGNRHLPGTIITIL